MAIVKELDQVKPEDRGTQKGTQTEVSKEQPKSEGETVKAVEIDGKEVPVSKIQEAMEALENKGKWEKSLTQKGQQIAEDAKIVEQFKPYSDWSKLPENQKKVTEIQTIIDRTEEAKKEVEGELEEVEVDSPAVAKILKKYDTKMVGFAKTMEAIQEGILQKQDDANVVAIQQEEKEVKTKYKNLTEKDLDKIMKYSAASKGASLVTIADEYVEDLEEFRKKSIKAYLEKKEKTGEDFIETGPAGTSPEGKTKLYGDDTNSSRAAFAREIRRINKGGD